MSAASFRGVSTVPYAYLRYLARAPDGQKSSHPRVDSFVLASRRVFVRVSACEWRWGFSAKAGVRQPLAEVADSTDSESVHLYIRVWYEVRTYGEWPCVLAKQSMRTQTTNIHPTIVEIDLNRPISTHVYHDLERCTYHQERMKIHVWELFLALFSMGNSYLSSDLDESRLKKKVLHYFSTIR